MFHKIPSKILERMKYLEQIDMQNEVNGSYSKMIWQIPKETGKFIALMATTVPKGNFIEIGTGGGYSALWLALACRELGGSKITTFEILKEKAELAKETFELTKTVDIINLVIGNALDYLDELENISFCFLDTDDKSIYEECYEKVILNMVKGGIFIADNAISHKFTLKSMFDKVFKDKRVDAIIVPVGKGELVCRKSA